jgi:TRAP-type transport system periplasmic protein
MRRRALACQLALLLGVTGCTARAADRAGGNAQDATQVVRVVQPFGSRPAQLEPWSREVTTLSDGHLKIELKDAWHAADAANESRTIRDVQHGFVDAAWVGARILDRFGVTAFQPFLAPLLVNSYELEGAVFDAGIPEEMVAGLNKLGLVGVGVLPGPMRKMLGVDAPFTDPASFAGKRIAFQDSALTGVTFNALRAQGEAVAGGASVRGFDGLEQQLQSIYGNRYDAQARFVTGNLNLWPRPLVMVMNRDAYERLGKQGPVLQQAAQRAESAALDASRREDRDALEHLCQLGMSIPEASSGDLSALRAALQPVYASVRTDPKNGKWLARIESLKAKLDAPPDTSRCADTAGGSGAPVGRLDGMWESTLTARDWDPWPTERQPGRFHLSFDRGTMTIIEPGGIIGYRASFKAYRGRLETSSNLDVLQMEYALAGDTLELNHIKVAGDSCMNCSPYSIVLGSHPWRRVGTGP